MLATRIRTALIALPLFLGALFYLPKPGWMLFLLPWLLIGAWEWSALAQWRRVARVQYVLLTGALCAVLWIFVIIPVRVGVEMAVYLVASGFWLAVAPWWLARGRRIQHSLALALTGWIVLLPMWLAMVQLRAEPRVLLMLMIVLWIADTAAFFCGKRWGRHKLAPSISPGKTWEGVAGALAGTTLYYGVISSAFPAGHAVLSGLMGLFVFWLLTALGVEGDLFESWIKRTAGVKDSGTVLPGHGGVLDRVDALTSTLPVAALILACYA